MQIRRVDKALMAIGGVLGLSVLLTGGLAVYLTLAWPDAERGLTAGSMELTVTPLVDGEAWVLWPERSADGEHLLFTRGLLIRRSGLPYGNLWVYDVVSGSMDQLTTAQGFDGLGAWSP
jgi:hypothetical protein